VLVLSLVMPRSAEAQSSGKFALVGVLYPGGQPLGPLEAFRDGLRERGYVEGRNLKLEWRFAEGHDERLPQLARELLSLKVDTIFAINTQAAQAAKSTSATIPIVVATASDFVAAGLVRSLARPGGNLTGTNDEAAELAGKQVEVLAAVLPRLQRVALIWDSTNPGLKTLAQNLDAQVRRLNVAILSVPVVRLTDVETSVDKTVQERAQAIVVALGGWTLSNRARIIQASLSRRLPVVSASRLFAEDGALASYGPDLPAVYKHAATFVDKILRGTPPGDIPVEQPTKFELVINLKTAKALGLTIPPSLLGRADEVIQ